MYIEGKRLKITEFTMDMAEAVHLNSLDEDNRRFVPDEVFETIEDAEGTVGFLMSCYGGKEGPFVYPVLLNDGSNIGYVQLVPIEEGWEIGYHIAKKYTGQGYATEAVTAFLPVIMKEMKLDVVYGVCLSENRASCAVMEHCGFVKDYEGLGNYQGEEKTICKYSYSQK